jgi:hypothetical protein
VIFFFGIPHSSGAAILYSIHGRSFFAGIRARRGNLNILKNYEVAFENVKKKKTSNVVTSMTLLPAVLGALQAKPLLSGPA